MQRVEYEAGNEHSPTDRLGRIRVELPGDGTARVDHYGWTGHRAWTARVDDTFAVRLRRALADAGFPAVPQTMPMSGARMRQLLVTDGTAGRRGEILVPWEESAELPGYREAFGLLDGLVAAVGGPDTGAAALQPAPTDVQALPDDDR